MKRGGTLFKQEQPDPTHQGSQPSLQSCILEQEEAQSWEKRPFLGLGCKFTSQSSVPWKPHTHTHTHQHPLLLAKAAPCLSGLELLGDAVWVLSLSLPPDCSQTQKDLIHKPAIESLGKCKLLSRDSSFQTPVSHTPEESC